MSVGGRGARAYLWVGEENDPVVANELVEVNGALGGLGLEVGGSAAQTKRLWSVGHDEFCALSVSGRKREHEGWRGRRMHLASCIPCCVVCCR